MMNRTVILLCIAVSWWLVCSARADSDAAGARSNPHTGVEGCFVCHLRSAAELDQSDVPRSEKLLLRTDAVTLCTNCHGTSFGHGVGRRPAVNREKLPLDRSGFITCAMTCHDMHVKRASEPHQQNFHLRLPVDRLCTSCHDK